MNIEPLGLPQLLLGKLYVSIFMMKVKYCMWMLHINLWFWLNLVFYWKTYLASCLRMPHHLNKTKLTQKALWCSHLDRPISACTVVTTLHIYYISEGCPVYILYGIFQGLGFGDLVPCSSLNSICWFASVRLGVFRRFWWELYRQHSYTAAATLWVLWYLSYTAAATQGVLWYLSYTTAAHCSYSSAM